MYKKKVLQSKRCGFAMALVLCAIVLLLITGTGLLNLGFHSRSFGARTCSEIIARSAADASLTKAVFDMNQKLKVHPYDESTLPIATYQPLIGSDATYSYTIAGGTDHVYTVRCIGYSGQSDRRINATLRLKGLFDQAILAQETITLKTGTVVEGYDSENPSEGDVPVKIATTSTDEGSISLDSSSVDGEVLMGVDGYFPVVSAPLLPDMNTSIYAKSETIKIGPEQSGKYTDITLLLGTDSTILEIEGDVVLHITGDVMLGNSCELKIKSGSSLILYLEGNLNASNSAGFYVVDEDPSNFVLYGIGDEDQTIDLKAKTTWYGCIYAPNADISIKAGAEIYGSFICANFDSKPGGYIYYDTALQNPSTTDIGVSFVVDYWQEE